MKEYPREKEKQSKIRAFFQSVSQDGFWNTARKAVWHCRTALRRVRKNCTPRIVRLYRISTARKGKRLAWQETLQQLKSDLLRPLRRVREKARMRKGGETPLVSFILPVYNVEKYLEQAMDGLISQTLKHIEIICVDDGSTDSSLEILRRYEQTDSRVRVLTQKNQFAGAARNHGLREARGEYVCFLDPDDFFERTLAEDTYLAAKTDRADAVLFNADRYNNVTGVFSGIGGLLHRKFMPLKCPFNRSDCPDTLYQITTPCPWTKLFRRQFLLDTGLQFQALRNTNDLFFVHSALAMAERIVTVDKNLVHYRQGMTTSLQATKEKDPFCFYEAHTALRDLLRERGLLEQLRRTYVNVALSGCMQVWKTQKNPQVQQTVGQFLRTRGFRELEILGHEKEYYYASSHYELMQQILSDAAQDGTV